MGVDGTWSLSMTTPLGSQQGTLILVADGGTLNGTFESLLGSGELIDGSVDGSIVRWQAQVVFPQPHLAVVESTVDGDAMQGTIDMGPPAPAPFTGTRIA